MMSFVLNKVSKFYKNHYALGPLSLQIREGKIYCIVGPSGCGKSTLLRLLAGFEHPTQGQLFWNSSASLSPSPERWMIFQDATLLPWKTIFENVEFVLKNLPINNKDRKTIVTDALRKVHLDRFADFYPFQISGGMKQRVAIARALVLSPPVLLMDEPFGALDAQTRDQLLHDLQDIFLSNPMTIVFVTHNVREASCLGDKIILLSHSPGKIIKEYPMECQRIRHIEDPLVIDRAREILSDLRSLRRTTQDALSPDTITLEPNL